MCSILHCLPLLNPIDAKKFLEDYENRSAARMCLNYDFKHWLYNNDSSQHIMIVVLNVVRARAAITPSEDIVESRGNLSFNTQHDTFHTIVLNTKCSINTD